MGTSGGSYPSKICSEVRRDHIDDDVITPPRDTLAHLRESFSGRGSLLTQSSSSSLMGFFNSQEYNNILNNPQRFEFDKKSTEEQAAIVKLIIKNGIYIHVSTEYAKFKTIILGIKFLHCLYQTENAKKCLYQIVTKELIKGTLENVSDNLSETVTNLLWDGVEDEFIENGISSENLRPIHQAFQYSMQKSIDGILEKDSDKEIDISYEYIEDFLTDVDIRFQFKEATSNSKKYKSASLRKSHVIRNGGFVSTNDMNDYRARLSESMRKHNSEVVSRISAHKEKILYGNYNFKRDYLKDVKKEEIREINTEKKTITESKYSLKNRTNHCRKVNEYHITPNGKKRETDLKGFKGLFTDGLLPTALKDLLTIADYLHYFDIAIKRNTKTTREQKYVIRIYTPIADFWNDPNRKYSLQRAVYELMEENIIFRFLGKDEPVVTLPKKWDDKKVINLFSGGLDSLSGVVGMLRDKKISPLFVSVRKPNTLRTIQEGLLKELSERFGRELEGLEYIYRYNTDGNYVGPKDRYYHPTQRSRSFLYLTVALIYAIGKGSRKILIHENGIISVLDDVPFIQSERFTRTVHPDFIRMYNRLIESLIGERITVENPFSSSTKTEIINRIIENTDETFALKIVEMTESCSNTGNQWSGLTSRYCGACTPCLLKTLALLASKIDTKKIPPPQIDIFKMQEISDEKHDEFKGKVRVTFQGELTLRDIYYLAGKIRVLSKDVVSNEFPILRDRKTYNLFRKFSDELLSIKLDTNTYKTFKALQEKVVS